LFIFYIFVWLNDHTIYLNMNDYFEKSQYEQTIAIKELLLLSFWNVVLCFRKAS
jgi:hypothetical protein